MKRKLIAVLAAGILIGAVGQTAVANDFLKNPLKFTGLYNGNFKINIGNLQLDSIEDEYGETMKTPPYVLIEDSLYIPLRKFSEALGLEVQVGYDTWFEQVTIDVGGATPVQQPMPTPTPVPTYSPTATIIYPAGKKKLKVHKPKTEIHGYKTTYDGQIGFISYSELPFTLDVSEYSQVTIEPVAKVRTKIPADFVVETELQ